MSLQNFWRSRLQAACRTGSTLISAPAPSIISAKCLKEFDDFVCLFCPRSLEHILGYPEMINALYHLNYNNAIPVCKISSIQDSIDNPSSSAPSSFWQQQKNAKAQKRKGTLWQPGKSGQSWNPGLPNPWGSGAAGRQAGRCNAVAPRAYSRATGQSQPEVFLCLR